MPIGTEARPTRSATGPPTPIHSDLTDPDVIPKHSAAPPACNTAAACGRRWSTAATSAATATAAPTTAAATGKDTTGATTSARCGTIASTAGSPTTTHPA